jgi:GNAT superfamily N-acetyltransferase
MTVQTPAITARKVRAADRAAVVAAMAAAFYDDPVFRWMSPDDEHRRRLLPDFFELATGIFARHDEIWCVGDPVAGGAIWSPAGVEPMNDEAGALFEARCTEIAGPDAGRWSDVIALLDDNHPHHADHDYLWLLGVRPGLQGCGLGTAMLRAVLDRADRTGVAAYLEATSPDNRRLYQRHGFVVTGELAIVGGPSLWAMWREPLG